jgi:hypothetical protein
LHKRDARAIEPGELGQLGNGFFAGDFAGGHVGLLLFAR